MAVDKPILHGLDFAGLRDLDLPAQCRQLFGLCMRGNHCNHHERLIVMMDHALHELHVSFRIVVVVKLRDFCNQGGSLTGCTGLNDRRRFGFRR